MESINFNDFSATERHEIIKAFLLKMRNANSMKSAHSFFEYYLKKFYRIPPKLLDDIVYCQGAMKTYLTVHMKIGKIFDERTNDHHLNKEHLMNIEHTLCEINAECQYLTVWLQDDIDRFCLPFTEQHMQPNTKLIEEILSKAIVPHISASSSPIKPHFVIKRFTQTQLLRKIFTSSGQGGTLLPISDENERLAKSNVPKKKTLDTAATNNRQADKSQAPRADSRTDVTISRLNLQAALQKARLNQNLRGHDKIESSKQLFMQYFGLCRKFEIKRKLSAQAQSQKLKPKPNKK